MLYPEIIINKSFGQWTVIADLGRDYKSNRIFNCKCSCGKEKIKTIRRLKTAIACQQCVLKERNAMPDIIGKRFGKWIIIKQVDNKRRQRRYLGRCDCGFEKELSGYHLRAGNTSSCQHCRVKLHGMSYTTTYRCWRDMIKRCSNPSMKCYKNYGGRGITVCDRWKIFENFLADMGERPPTLQIDRINNDGNYEPGNCRWATLKENHANRRCSRKGKK